MPLHSEIADQLERIAAIRIGAEKAKALLSAVARTSRSTRTKFGRQWPAGG